MRHGIPKKKQESKSLITNPAAFEQLDDVGEEGRHFLRGLPGQELGQGTVPAFDGDGFFCTRGWFDRGKGRIEKQGQEGMFGSCGARRSKEARPTEEATEWWWL